MHYIFRNRSTGVINQDFCVKHKSSNIIVVQPTSQFGHDTNFTSYSLTRTQVYELIDTKVSFLKVLFVWMKQRMTFDIFVTNG